VSPEIRPVERTRRLACVERTPGTARAGAGRRISVERHPDPRLADAQAALGHEVVDGEAIPNDWVARHDFMRSFEGCAQAIALAGDALCGASDPRLDGIAAPL
jgi:hypothetical protein